MFKKETKCIQINEDIGLSSRGKKSVKVLCTFTWSDFSSSFRLLISFSFNSALAWCFPWNVKLLLHLQNAIKTKVQRKRILLKAKANGWHQQIYNPTYWITVEGIRSSHLLLFDVSQFGLKLEKKKTSYFEREVFWCENKTSRKAHLLLSGSEQLCVLLCDCFILMLQWLLIKNPTSQYC